MTVINITPDADVGIATDVTGAASMHAALADASDGTYVQLGFSAPRRVKLTSPTKPATQRESGRS